MMRSIALVLTALLFGCDNHLLDPSGFRLEKGRPVNSAFSGAFAFGGVLKAESTKFTTNSFVIVGIDCIDSQGKQRTFEAYLQAPLDGTIEGELDLESGAVNFNSGWGYFTGMRPMASTTTIGAGSDGTRLVLEIIEESATNNEYRVYLLPQLGNHSVTITGALNETMMTSGRYLHIKNGAKIADGHITSDQAAKTFIERVRDTVKPKGMDWPLFWP